MSKTLNLAGVNKGVVARAILTIIFALNILFGYLGWHLIPLTDSDVTGLVDGAIVLATAVIWAWGWWKNNSLTVNAQIADVILDELNEEI